MEEMPLASRRPEDERLFTQPNTDPAITPDRVSPTVEGYFRVPAVWIGEAPDPKAVRTLNPSIHHAVVCQARLGCGIEVRAWRDGTFLFDFSTWPPAPMVMIPGYRRPDINTSCRVPNEHTSAENQAETYAVIRAQVINAHQVCLSTAEMDLRRLSATMGLPVSAWSTIKAISLDAQPSYFEDTENLHGLAQNIFNNSYSIARSVPLQRRIVELEVVEHSFKLLDQLLSKGDLVLLHMVEAAYLATSRIRDRCWGEAVTLGWSVCEQLMAIAWKQLLGELRASSKEGMRMPKERREKLMGRDYTASVITEVLEINGKIDHTLYRMLEVARRARNKWAHEMRAPKGSEAWVCIRAVESLLRQVAGVNLRFSTTERGGVPQWPVWVLEKVKTRRPNNGENSVG